MHNALIQSIDVLCPQTNIPSKVAATTNHDVLINAVAIVDGVNDSAPLPASSNSTSSKNSRHGRSRATFTGTATGTGCCGASRSCGGQRGSC